MIAAIIPDAAPIEILPRPAAVDALLELLADDQDEASVDTTVPASA